ncbi:MAG: sulfur carrier protein ThiS [Gammaproteobacteria bacterium]|nr:sulfur carrier protein ThiS [Gammaproteobacteria bacterium]
MQVLINGESHQFDNDMTISALLQQSGLAGKRVAVEVNETIVPKSQHAETRVSEGDKIEIIHAIGGG